MSARDHFDEGIAHLTRGDRVGARLPFELAINEDPTMCDAWLGLACVGDTSVLTLRGAHQSLNTLHRETRRIGLPDEALTPTVHTPLFIDLFPNTPTGITLAYVATLLSDQAYDQAEKLLTATDDPDPEQARIRRYLAATLYRLTERWADVLSWTSDLTGSGVVIDATRLLRGIAQTGLGQFEIALATLSTVVAEAGTSMHAHKAFYRGLCQRRLGDETSARTEFAAAAYDGQLLPEAAAALEDRTYGPITTTTDAINARTNRWDPTSGPSAEQFCRAQDQERRAGLLTEADDELNGYIGLEDIKHHVRRLKAIMRYDAAMRARAKSCERDHPELAAELRAAGQRTTLHLDLSGPPGTCKTSTARLLGMIYVGLEILDYPLKFLEVKRQHLVGEHIGDTEAKTAQWLNDAVGGVLFIDEAPELYKPDNDRDFGHIALDIIMGFAEEHRHDMMIVLAGYAGPMAKLRGANPGWKSRFPNELVFTSYTDDEVVAIARLFASRARFPLDKAADDRLTEAAKWLCTTPNTDPRHPDLEWRIDVLGNGRWARNVIGKAVDNAKARCAEDDTIDLLTADLDAIRTITLTDISDAIDALGGNR